MADLGLDGAAAAEIRDQLWCEAAAGAADQHAGLFLAVAAVAAIDNGQIGTSREIAFCAHTIKTRDPLVVPDATLDERFMRNPLVTGDPWMRSYLRLPLETPDGYNLGALCAISMKPRNFDASQVKSFAALILNELELRQIAISDGLTGATTHRSWVEIAEKEIARYSRSGTEAAIIMFDVDHFKAVIDAYGHSAGDTVLRTLTQRSLAELRKSDCLGRIGGQHFAVLLPNTSQADAAGLAERLRQRFAEMPVTVDGIDLRVTASFGALSLSKGVTFVDGLLAGADRLL